MPHTLDPAWLMKVQWSHCQALELPVEYPGGLVLMIPSSSTDGEDVVVSSLSDRCVDRVLLLRSAVLKDRDLLLIFCDEDFLDEDLIEGAGDEDTLLNAAIESGMEIDEL